MSESKRGGAQLARAVEKAYQAGLDDYHLEPMVLVENGRPVGKISDGDSAVFCCRRGEREIELTELFTDPNFDRVERNLLKDLDFVIMTMYHDKFKDLPVTGTNGEPYVEQIIDVAPQVIVMSAYASCDADELSAKTGIPVFVVPGSDTTLDDAAYETIRLLGELYGLETRAQELTKYLKGIQTDLDTRTAKIADDQKPSVYVGGVSFKGNHGFEGTEAGYGPFALIHAKNLADTTGQAGAFNIDTEQVLAWDPDVIFLDFNGMSLINEDYQAHPDFYKSLSAVRDGKVYSQISFRSCASNLETALADAYYAACMLYPEQFADVDPEVKAGEIFTELLGSNPYPDLKEAGYAFRAITIGE